VGPEERLEARGVVRGGDDQDIVDPRHHQGGKGIINHRLVVDRLQLLAGDQGEGVEPVSGPAGEKDALGNSLVHADLSEIIITTSKYANAL
jgi:hypothetical protein